MAEVREGQGQLVFGLDIGTRSIVGTVGYLAGGKFHVMAQRSREHETRAMLDGQIHDIGKVGDTIAFVKKQLEQDLNRKLTEVCIAAAGRVLRTVTTYVEVDFEAEREVKDEDIYALSMDGVEKAYEEFQHTNDTGLKFYCVGYTPMRYYMNGYHIINLEGHKAKSIGADIIATFLPDDVVDGLYRAVERAGLHVANMTLEPIAAIQVAIPEKFRMLNMALVDVGAGTSDISITKDGTIIAYGMIPVAGDSLTEIIVQHCLVDFETAETIKRSVEIQENIVYTDIMGLTQSISSDEIMVLVDDAVEEMTGMVADCIKELNGDKPVSAVFVVGGGGKIPGYTKKLAEKLGIVQERVAIRGEEVMQNIVFENDDAVKDSMMVTPIGIALSFYEQSNNFIFVDFNGEKLKLYDNGRLTVADAAMQMSFSNEDLFPKRGKPITFTVNGKPRMVRGMQGEAAVITVNDEISDMYRQIRSGDMINIKPSSAGEDARQELGKISELSDQLHVTVNGKKIDLPKTAEVNGTIENEFYLIKDGDEVNVHNYYTVKEIAAILDVENKGAIEVNGSPANENTRVYDSFTVELNLEISTPEYDYHTSEEDSENISDAAAEHEQTTLRQNVSEQPATEQTTSKQSAPDKTPDLTYPITVTVNGKPVTMKGKSSYVYVDVFDYIDFDLQASAGRGIVTKLNGNAAEFLKEIYNGDIIEVYWDEKK